MQVTAGGLKGRQFASPPGACSHPMSDRVKNALFNTLGDITGLDILDAFGGSGALAFEALSRGAQAAVVCEINKRASETIRKNISSLSLADKVTLKELSVYTYANKSEQAFDIILVDPPYDQWEEQKPAKLLPILKPGGLMILSMPQNFPAPELPGLSLLKRSRYGNASLVFLRLS